MRTVNVLAPAAYIQRLSAPSGEDRSAPFPRSPATTTLTPIDRQAEIGETMMMGLRLVGEGVAAAGFEQRFGESLQSIFGPVIERLVGQGLLEWAGRQSSLCP
jgi:oxygen-independent coproporphyrinogen-3 oxidase